MEATDQEASRVEAMIERIAKVTGTSIEIEALRPLALECVRREHKDAWAHTLAVLKSKMVCDRKPTMPNRFAATVLKNALASPVPPPAAKRNQAPAPPAAAPAKAQEPRAEAPATLGDAPAPWAMRQARHELSGRGAAAFKQEYGRHSVLADWEARAKELEAEVAKKLEAEAAKDT